MVKGKGKGEEQPTAITVIEELKAIYKKKILPIEQVYRYDYFHQPFMTDAEFDSKPHVMLVGQYSVGKTTFIRYLLGKDFPGQRIGPEPTTDRFTVVFGGPDEQVIPGNALASSNDHPYRGLDRFGIAFLNRFEGSQVPSCEVLRKVTLVDTPGVLSGEKQRINRGYDFTEVTAWFALRSDLIILLFDTHKLDISDEFSEVMKSFKGNDDKVRCILNKADQVDRQKLMKVYGALLWSLGKVITTPEVMRVYIGSFWDQPLHFKDNAELLEKEEKDLMLELTNLPNNSALRKINELVKRLRVCKVHSCIISHLKGKMPLIIGHARRQKKLIESLPEIFRTVMKEHNLPSGDFPDVTDFQAKLEDLDFRKFRKFKAKLFDRLEEALTMDIPRLLMVLPRSDNCTSEESKDTIRES